MTTPRMLSVFFLLLAATASIPAQRVYWDEPRSLEQGNITFFEASSGGGLTVVVWQERDVDQSYLSLRSSRDMVDWSRNLRFSGPFEQETQDTPVFSLAVDGNGRILLAVVSGENEVTLMLSEDGGVSFSKSLLVSSLSHLSPRLFIRGGGRGFFLFMIHLLGP